MTTLLTRTFKSVSPNKAFQKAERKTRSAFCFVHEFFRFHACKVLEPGNKIGIVI